MSELLELKIENNIALLQMNDPKNKNAFSKEMQVSMLGAFDKIKTSDAKVVILTGTGNFFSVGFSKQHILDMVDGKAVFKETFPFMKLLLECELPTISAVQGHAVGAGFIFSLYSDLIVLAEECLYTIMFLQYGLTPGDGASYFLPAKVGITLGPEIIYTGKSFQGWELKERGFTGQLVKKTEVLSTAINLAKELAQKPKLSLKLLKEHLNKQLKKEINSILNNETSLMEQSLKNAETREKVLKLYAG